MPPAKGVDLADLYHEVGDMKGTVGKIQGATDAIQGDIRRLGGKVDSIVTTIDAHLQDDQRNFSRIDRKIAWAAGFVAAVAVVANFVLVAMKLLVK